ncbi:phosphate transport system regulatory protein PhoU [Clostridium gelidum]|uniref:Phosphate-specific transport system accessory protein PhoU n=1 Tax=Clostridium gelidum TaxID=704125 RepID=A0ABN6J4Q0_9CLOT|nr:phosphate signaling complex protein PhoU [Clostridium gelidum]BCZ48203.1 phosphate transport system regulatory protein PhoU [Clostridium gelidum]
MTRGSQDIKVKNIHRELVTMASLVEKQIYQSMLSLKNYDIELANKIINNDDKVDDMQKVIEEQCIKYIASEQPLATDLRKIMTASKIVTDLERMADHAVDICKITKKIGEDIKLFKKSLDALWEMEEKVRSMIGLAINSYINDDDDMAYKICLKDDEIDSFYKDLFAKFVSEMKLDESLTEKGIRLLFVIKYLERIGDHVTNICESTVYSKSGVYVDLNE